MEQALGEYLGRLRTAYPTFARFGVGDEDLVKRERSYKLELVHVFQERVQSFLKELPVDETAQSRIGGELVGIFTKPLSDGHPQNLVGWRYWTPLTKLTAAGRATFARLTADLLYGSGELAGRVDRFVPKLKELFGEAVGESAWPAMSRSLTSFLLMLSNPAEHVIVKTQEFRRAYRAFKGTTLPNRALNGSDYTDIQDFLKQLRSEMDRSGLSPRDLIDVQTLIWVGDPRYGEGKEERQYWLLGANWGGDDKTPVFVAEGRWENGYDDRYLDEVKSVKTGDRVAIKAAFTQKHDLPFDNRGQTVSCMHIKAVGTVTRNAGDGRNLEVEWEKDFEAATIYAYTYRSTIDRLDKKKYPKVVKWVFDSEPQPLDELEEMYRSRPSGETPEHADRPDDDQEASTAPRHDPINLIFYGPPGCGKTYRLEIDLMPKYAGSDGKRYTTVTFHPSMSYEEFVEGLRPVVDEKAGEIRYEVKPGIFREICEAARRDPSRRYALFIDEINRANISKVFGELITLIEVDKRSTPDGKKGMHVTLPYSRVRFGVPENLDIYGTMNSADRSIALLDTALRRRFQFEEINPEEGLLNADVEGINLRQLLATLNQRIEILLDRDHRLGHSYLLGVTDFSKLCEAFSKQILPLLAEYFHDDWSQIALVLVNRDLRKSEFVLGEEVNPNNLFGAAWEDRPRRGKEVHRRYHFAREFTPAMFLGLLT